MIAVPQLVLDPAKALAVFFQENVQEWKNTPNVGIKFLQLDGYTIRNLSVSTLDLLGFWRKVASLLPADTMFVRYPPTDGPFILQAVCDGSYSDAYLVILGSAEWPKLPEGGAIPIIVATFEGENITGIQDK